MIKQTRNRLIDTENIFMIARWKGGWRISKKGEGIQKYKLVVTEQSQDVQYSVGNIVNNVVMTMYGARWVLDLLG